MTPEPYTRYRVDEETGCWIWAGPPRGTGYGEFWHGGKRQSAHRAFYAFFVGPIPEGLVLDHLCRNTLCVNPAHLEPVTIKENVLRGDGMPATNKRKTHCLRGHAFTDDNTQPASKGGRECKRCRIDRDRKRKSPHRVALCGCFWPDKYGHDASCASMAA